MDVYGEQLARIVGSLSRKGFLVAVRGEAAARFAHAEGSGRAVEVSQDGTGFFVEFFEEPVEAPVRQLEEVTLDDAAKRTTEWLSGVEA